MNYKTRVLILCAGESTRWNNYLGCHKHLIPIDGERLLDRTVRLVKKICPLSDIFVFAKTKEYMLPGTNLYMPILTPSNYEADKYLSSKHLWNRNGRTVVLLGDVYFTEKALHTIFGFKDRKWQVFGRADKSSCLPYVGGELFAQSFYSEHIPIHQKKLNILVKFYQKMPKSMQISGWQHFRLMGDFDMLTHKPDKYLGSPFFTQIDDMTEDFDYPYDYDNWIEVYERKNLENNSIEEQ